MLGTLIAALFLVKGPGPLLAFVKANQLAVRDVRTNITRAATEPEKAKWRQAYQGGSRARWDVFSPDGRFFARQVPSDFDTDNQNPAYQFRQFWIKRAQDASDVFQKFEQIDSQWDVNGGSTFAGWAKDSTGFIVHRYSHMAGFSGDQLLGRALNGGTFAFCGYPNASGTQCIAFSPVNIDGSSGVIRWFTSAWQGKKRVYADSRAASFVADEPRDLRSFHLASAHPKRLTLNGQPYEGLIFDPDYSVDGQFATWVDSDDRTLILELATGRVTLLGPAAKPLWLDERRLSTSAGEILPDRFADFLVVPPLSENFNLAARSIDPGKGFEAEAFRYGRVARNSAGHDGVSAQVEGKQVLFTLDGARMKITGDAPRQATDLETPVGLLEFDGANALKIRSLPTHTRPAALLLAEPIMAGSPTVLLDRVQRSFFLAVNKEARITRNAETLYIFKWNGRSFDRLQTEGYGDDSTEVGCQMRAEDLDGDGIDELVVQFTNGESYDVLSVYGWDGVRWTRQLRYDFRTDPDRSQLLIKGTLGRFADGSGAVVLGVIQDHGMRKDLTRIVRWKGGKWVTLQEFAGAPIAVGDFLGDGRKRILVLRDGTPSELLLFEVASAGR